MFRSTTIMRELVLGLAKVMFITLMSLKVMWQHVLGVACVLCAVQNESELWCVYYMLCFDWNFVND
jgi:hypothetical protein